MRMQGLLVPRQPLSNHPLLQAGWKAIVQKYLRETQLQPESKISIATLTSEHLIQDGDDFYWNCGTFAGESWLAQVRH